MTDTRKNQTHPINIKIIYDSKYEKKGRTCYWLNIGKKIVESPSNEKTKVIIKIDDHKPEEIISKTINSDLSDYDRIFSFEFISVKEILNSENPTKIVKDLFEKGQTDIIIINWDSINGDPVYGSFEAYQFFDIYAPVLNEWVEDGGIIILEAQSILGKLEQRPYDIFTKEAKNCYVKTFNELDRGDIAIINRKLVNLHPILTNISNNKWEPKIDPEPGFPEPVLSIIIKKRRLFAGYFSQYSKDWEPLLYADVGMKKPIMLCRLVKKENDENVGGYILTTMYIGATSFDPIVKNLLISSRKLERYYNDKMEGANKRRGTYLKAFIVFIIISTSVGLLFSQGLISYSNSMEFIKKNFLQLIATICAVILVLFGPGNFIRILTKWKGKD